MNESAKIFSSEENEAIFYESRVGLLCDDDIKYGLTQKFLYETNELYCRLELRRDKLQKNLKKYGAEIFSGYARDSLPPSFVLELITEIKTRAKIVQVKISDLDSLCPERNSGFQKIASKEKGKSRGLVGCKENLQILTNAIEENLLIHSGPCSCTNFDIYNFNYDDATHKANELLAIRNTLHIWKRKKWPNLALKDLLNEELDERTLELQNHFEMVYFLILEHGRHFKLPRIKFHYR